MKKHILVLMTALVLSAASFANDKGNVFDQGLNLSQMGSEPLNALRLTIFLSLRQKEIVRSENGLILVSGLGLLAGREESLGPLESLLGASDAEIGEGRINLFIKALISAIKGSQSISLASITTDVGFYAAFGTQALKVSLEHDPFTEAERASAGRMIDVVTATFWEAVKATVIAEVGQDGWVQFTRSVDSSRLGYALP